MQHLRNTLWLPIPRTLTYVIQKLLKSHDFWFSPCCSFSAFNFRGSFWEFFHPGNETAELALSGGTVPLGSSYWKQAGILSRASWCLVQHLTTEHKNLSCIACWHFWSSGYFPGTHRADCLGLSELDTGRIQFILLAKYRISGKDSHISSIRGAGVRDSLKITLKANLKNGWPAVFGMCCTTFLSLRGFQGCHTRARWGVY